MLKKINFIKKFGVFQDFQWSRHPQLDDFSTFNLLYAWNYSGKTTLSRIFRSIELGTMHPDFDEAEFEAEFRNGVRITNDHLSTSIAVRVFNSDFVSQQLKWHDGSDKIEPIFILGQENIEMREQLDELKTFTKKLEEDYFRANTELTSKRSNLEKTVSTRAANMKKEFEMPDYNRPKLERSIDTVLKSTPSLYELTDEEYQKALKISVLKNKKAKLDVQSFPVIQEKELLSKVTEISWRRVVSKVIEKLQNNSDVNDWVREGKGLHTMLDVCHFCGSPLPHNLLTELEEHFSKDFEQLMSDINSMQIMIGASEKELDSFLISLPDKARYYEESEVLVEEVMTELHSVVDGLKAFLTGLIQPLNYKKSTPFSQHGAVDSEAATAVTLLLKDDSYSAKCIELVERINNVIRDHNKRTDEFESSQQAAKNKVIMHQATQFLAESQYTTKRDSIVELEGKLGSLSAELSKARTDIKTLESKLLDASKGAEKINDYLRMFFRHNRLQLEVKTDGKFLLKRNGRIAKNLSEGEKAAISFVYFITQLENRDTVISDTIIFIDDPISSLDQNHIHGVFAFIKAKLFAEKACLQFFVSTHNMEFFGLMKDLAEDLKYPLPKKEKPEFASHYFIERINNEHDETHSSLIPLPVELMLFKSEYVYLFSVLKKFQSSSGSDFNMRYVIPHVTRRFLESYLNFKTPSNASLFKKLETFFENASDRFRVYKFLNEYSHNALSERHFYLPELTECSEITTMVLTAIEMSDQAHYDSLVEICP